MSAAVVLQVYTSKNLHMYTYFSTKMYDPESHLKDFITVACLTFLLPQKAKQSDH